MERDGWRGPWTTSTPRNADLYTTMNAPDTAGNYNILLSSWSTYPPSNQNDSFLQLAEYLTTPSVTSASGSWDATRTVFTVAVSGADAPYPWSRMWQPDNGVAWGVTFTDYAYSFTATFSAPAAVDADGWLSNTVLPDTIIGTFSGDFVVTYDVNKNPITNGDTYGFDIDFSKAMFMANGGTYTGESYFGTPVPVPAAVLLGMVGLGVAGMKLRKFV